MEAPAWERTPQEFKAVSCWKVWSSTVGRLQIIRILYMPESILDLIMYYMAMYACICMHVCRCVMNACTVRFLPSKIAVDNSLYSHPLPSMSHSSDEYVAHHDTPQLLLQTRAASLKSLNWLSETWTSSCFPAFNIKWTPSSKFMRQRPLGPNMTPTYQILIIYFSSC